MTTRVQWLAQRRWPTSWLSRQPSFNTLTQRARSTMETWRAGGSRSVRQQLVIGIVLSSLSLALVQATLLSALHLMHQPNQVHDYAEAVGAESWQKAQTAIERAGGTGNSGNFASALSDVLVAAPFIDAVVVLDEKANPLHSSSFGAEVPTTLAFAALGTGETQSALPGSSAAPLEESTQESAQIVVVPFAPSIRLDETAAAVVLWVRADSLLTTGGHFAVNFLALLATLALMPVMFWLQAGNRVVARHEELLNEYNQDELTGLGHERHLNEILSQEVALARSLERDLSVVSVELHDLQQELRDVGRLHVDALLVAAAGVLRHERPSNAIFRVRDSFVVVLPRMDMPDSYTVARQLSTRITSTLGLDTVAAASSLDERTRNAHDLLYSLDKQLARARDAATPAESIDEVWDLRYMDEF